MQTCLVGKRGIPHVRQTLGRLQIRDFRHPVRGAGQLGQTVFVQQGTAAHLDFDVADKGEDVGVAGAFPVAVHAALDLHRSGFDGSHRVRHGTPRVIVGMNPDFNLLEVVFIQVGAGFSDSRADGRGQVAPIGVTQHDGFRPRLPGGLQHFQPVLGIVSQAVKVMFSVQEHPPTCLDQELHRVAHHRQVFLTGGFQGISDVTQIRFCHQGNDRRAGIQQCQHLRVLASFGPHLAGGAKSCQGRMAQLQFRQRQRKKLGVFRNRAGPAAFNKANSQVIKGLGDIQLVRYGQRDALHLGAITQSGVVYLYRLGRRFHAPMLQKSPARD